MNRLVFLCLLAIALHLPAISHAEESTDDLLRRMEMQNRESQQQIEKSRLEWQQLENERLRSQAEFERGNAELERLRAETERYEAAEKQQELTDRAEQAAQEQEESAQKTEEVAEEMRSNMLQAEVKHKNQMFLVVVFLTTSIFLWSVIKKYRKEGVMKDFEKFGIVTILASGLLILLVLMVSEPWVERFDFIQNLMTALEFHLFKKEEFCSYSCEHFIAFPAKYAVLTLIGLATYGFTTYLGITPPFKRKNNNEPEKAQDSTSLD